MKDWTEMETFPVSPVYLEAPIRQLCCRESYTEKVKQQISYCIVVQYTTFYLSDNDVSAALTVQYNQIFDICKFCKTQRLFGLHWVWSDHGM